MNQHWSVLLLCAAAALCFLCRASGTNVDCATGTGNLQNNLPLPDQSLALHLWPNSTSADGTQVVIPQMSFGCSGRITAWTVHTLIITRVNYIEVLTHRIAMQVWRPSPSSPGQYSLIGSNEFRFTGADFTNSITRRTDTTDAAFFSFTKNLTENEQIYFAAGDVIGWYEFPERSINPPLSVIYREPLRNDSVSSVVRLLVDRTARESCSLCDTSRRLEPIDNVVPLVSVDFRVGQELTSCSGTCNNSSSQPNPTSTPPLATPVSTQPSDFNSAGQSSASQTNSVTTSDIVCIVIATITMVLHVILIALCSANFVTLKEIRKKLNSTVVPQSKSLNMIPAYSSNRNISNKTPADYDANPSAPTTVIPRDYETTNLSPSPTYPHHQQQTYESIDGGSKGMDRSNSMRLQVLKNAAGGTESPVWSRSENSSLDGSKIDLLNHKL